jgi:hypothetical protein
MTYQELQEYQSRMYANTTPDYSNATNTQVSVDYNEFQNLTKDQDSPRN